MLLSLACKDADSRSSDSQEKKYQAKMDEGRALMASEQPALAAKSFMQASGMAPDRTEPLLRMSEAHHRAGNSGAAILALKQAMSVNPAEAPDIKRKLAERYERDGLPRQAIAVLMEMREAEQLGDLDLLRLAHLQTQDGQHDAAFKTLERIQKNRPDDLDAKVVEAEILLAKGEEVLAAKLMDRLLQEQPGLTAARVLRARYFLRSGYAEYAQQDLEQLAPEVSLRPEIVTLRVEVLSALDRRPEAETLLGQAVAQYPQNADLLARLGQIQLELGNPPEALARVEQALRAQPGSARALYVRGLIAETAGDLPRAKRDFGMALDENGRFIPALNKLWRIHRQAGDVILARESLERLVNLGAGSLEDKVTLAEMYAQARTRTDLGLKLIAEALKQEPKNTRYQAIERELKKSLPAKKASGPLIIRGGRR
ncbi:tetratricopeptide repeat protein [Melittangium boletus]|uniref:tetratricopeptide repeat protein n=1 Tax=Melittangium boletus TaxID=83453 RepID=UPI003DA5B8E4